MMMKMNSESEKIVAVLHDVVEKSEWTLEDLALAGFSDSIIDAVDKLTKREGETYSKHIGRTKTNPLSRSVKLADLEDNMDAKRISDPSEEDEKRLALFREAWSELKKKG
jgi:(p)ppGpp synthase/HD superfamily hydrolase